MVHVWSAEAYGVLKCFPFCKRTVAGARWLRLSPASSRVGTLHNGRWNLSVLSALMGPGMFQWATAWMRWQFQVQEIGYPPLHGITRQQHSTTKPPASSSARLKPSGLRQCFVASSQPLSACMPPGCCSAVFTASQKVGARPHWAVLGGGAWFLTLIFSTAACTTGRDNV